ncbi:MAG: glycosyltransferase [Planctomycetota bacterium]
MMKLLFYEPDHNGHHFPYLARMLPGFIDPRFELCLATKPSALASDQYERFLKPFEQHLTLYPECAEFKGSSIRTAAHRAREIRQLQRRHNIQHTFVAYADGVWQILAARAFLGLAWSARRGTLEGILYRGGFTYPGDESFGKRIKRYLFKRMCIKGIFDRLLLDDEYLYDFSHCFAQRSKTRCELAVNPVELFDISRDAARADLKIESGRRVISLSGMIDERKGADRLVRAFVEASRGPDNGTVLVLAGPHKPIIRSLLQDPMVRPFVESKRIYSLDRLLDERDMFRVAAASDLVTAPYPNHSGRSSIVLWAAAAGRPVLGTDRGCIARIIEGERLGWTCNVLDNSEFSHHLVEAIDKPWDESDQARATDYARWHTISNYQKLNAEYVYTKYGRSPSKIED